MKKKCKCAKCSKITEGLWSFKTTRMPRKLLVCWECYQDLKIVLRLESSIDEKVVIIPA